MRNNAVSSSRWALSRWICASAGMTSLIALLMRWPNRPATSINRSLSLLIRLPRSPGEADAQLAVLQRRAHRVAGGQRPRQRDLSAVVADRDEQLAVLPGQAHVGAVDEGHLEGEDVLAALPLDPLGAALVEPFGGIPIAVDGLRHLQQHSLPDDLL